MKLRKEITHQIIISVPNQYYKDKSSDTPRKKVKAAYIGLTGTEELSSEDIKEKIISGLKNTGVLNGD